VCYAFLILFSITKTDVNSIAECLTGLKKKKGKLHSVGKKKQWMKTMEKRKSVLWKRPKGIEVADILVYDNKGTNGKINGYWLSGE